jgi:hypothetical protein
VTGFSRKTASAIAEELLFDKVCAKPELLVNKLQSVAKLNDNLKLRSQLAYGFLARPFCFETFRKQGKAFVDLDRRLARDHRPNEDHRFFIAAHKFSTEAVR